MKLMWTVVILLGGFVLAHNLASGTADALTNWCAAMVVIAYPIDGFLNAVTDYLNSDVQ